MKTRPEITDEEIRAYMDFDRLLEIQKQKTVSRSLVNNKYLLILGLSVAVSVCLWMMVSNEALDQAREPAAQNVGSPLQAVRDSVSNSGPQDSLKNSTGNETPKREVVKPQATLKSRQPVVIEPQKDNGEGKTDALQPERPVYVQASPVNGYPDLYEYFTRELRYPQEAMKDSIRGEVIAVFTINTQGLPEKIVIENSLGALFDAEVIRLITNMPPWKPATYNTKPVASKMSLPLTFQIKKIVSQK